jgi:hypothetical protein
MQACGPHCCKNSLLFAAFSSLTVKKIVWTMDPQNKPHEIEFKADLDGKGESEKRPLAPWS